MSSTTDILVRLTRRMDAVVRAVTTAKGRS